MMLDHPVSGDGITTEYVNRILEESGKDFHVSAVRVTSEKTYGQQMVSTAGRALIEVDYAPGAPAGLPTQLVVKLARGVDEIMAPFYRNEVAFYGRLRPELDLEVPQTLGGHFNPETKRFAILLEDLSVRGARFPNALVPVTLDEVRSILDSHAALHAQYWDSPRLKGDLDWIGTHTTGVIAEMQNIGATPFIQYEIDNQKFKTELVGALGSSGPELHAGMLALHRHHQTLPQTVLHGDSHIGNTYLTPQGKGGLLDWQLMVRGHHTHDVNYLITTALTIEQRRNHERELFAYYLDRLAAGGVTGLPAFEQSWLEFRRNLAWGLYYGWLTTPVLNYGWEINIVNHLRLYTAYQDHETGKLIKELM